MTSAFLSHTSEMASFPEDRCFVDAALDAIRQHGIVAKDMRDFAAEPTPPAEVCERYVRECDLYIGILGFRYGSPVRDRPQLSYTELEFLTAESTGLPRLMFLLNERAVLPAMAVLDLEYGKRQSLFRDRVLNSELTCGFFSSADELQRIVGDGLRSLGPRRRSTGPLSRVLGQPEYANSLLAQHLHLILDQAPAVSLNSEFDARKLKSAIDEADHLVVEADGLAGTPYARKAALLATALVVAAVAQSLERSRTAQFLVIEICEQLLSMQQIRIAVGWGRAVRAKDRLYDSARTSPDFHNDEVYLLLDQLCE